MAARDILLLVVTLSGEAQTTPYDKEWPCITAAKRLNDRGEQAWCLIETQAKRGKLEKYPMVPWPIEMSNGWGLLK